jgi:DNA-binding XRE family transcriptional regulator
MENLNSSQIKQLRCQMGWSQAEMARCLGCEREIVQAWELGSLYPDLQQNSALEGFQSQAKSLSQMMQLRPLVESLLDQQSLEQINDAEALECLVNAKLAHLDFKL